MLNIEPRTYHFWLILAIISMFQGCAVYTPYGSVSYYSPYRYYGGYYPLYRGYGSYRSYGYTPKYYNGWGSGYQRGGVFGRHGRH
jgi:hypothetical protein